MRDKLYTWWKRKHVALRKPVIFVLGVVLIFVSPFIGFLPGPGGIVVFLGGIAVLGSEFDWALALKAFFLEKVPREVKKRWQPTPRWEFVFDLTSILLVICSGLFFYYKFWSPFVSTLVGGITLFIFNRNRLDHARRRFRKSKRND